MCSSCQKYSKEGIVLTSARRELDSNGGATQKALLLTIANVMPATDSTCNSASSANLRLQAGSYGSSYTLAPGQVKLLKSKPALWIILRSELAISVTAGAVIEPSDTNKPPRVRRLN